MNNICIVKGCTSLKKQNPKYCNKHYLRAWQGKDPAIDPP